MKILLCDYHVTDSHEGEREILKKYIPEAVFEVFSYTNEEELTNRMQDVDVLMTCFLKIDRTLIEHAPKLKMISIDATGYGNVDIQAAKEKGIVVATLGDYCTDEVADHAMALILALEKNLKLYDRLAEEEKRYDFKAAPARKSLAGQTLAIVGYGRIGRAVAKRATAFGFRVLAVTRHEEQIGKTEDGVRFVSLKEALLAADVISNHMNQTPENEDYFCYDVFRQMEKKPLFVNVGRGACVQEEDLVRALEEGLIGGAGLDVLKDTKPALEKTGLLHRTNVILTPHSAFYSEEVMDYLAKVPTMNVVNFVKNEPGRITNIVT